MYAQYISNLNLIKHLDATNKDSIIEIAHINILPGFSVPHSCALSSDGKFLITADESGSLSGSIAIWNIDLNNIEFVTTYRPHGDLTSIAHNPFIKGNVLYVSHHKAGLRLIDIRNPFAPAEFAYHDTYPNSNANSIGGNWGCYPFFNSGKIISSDMQTGLYVHTIIHDPTFVTNVNALVRDFYLYQNYPNPFNPVTVIKFSLPNTQYTILRVYDALGKNVATLLNKKLGDGSFDVEFQGEKFPSGIYFYKLETDNFSEVKRMILLK